MRYHDADAAIQWLERALGFTQHAVYRHPDKGHVVHAELVHRRSRGGVGMVMLGSTHNESEMATHYRRPAEVGGVTSSAYLIVDDCDPVYAAAQSTSAEILMTLRTMDYGGKAFAVRDPEGHIWSVGEYDPFALLTA
ncbi:VOC family protein [Terriglobus aquaticus]|nr:VOC family protein [Terriglobus aquaticus]